jgi:hypothetical protein
MGLVERNQQRKQFLLRKGLNEEVKKRKGGIKEDGVS